MTRHTCSSWSCRTAHFARAVITWARETTIPPGRDPRVVLPRELTVLPSRAGFDDNNIRWPRPTEDSQADDRQHRSSYRAGSHGHARLTLAAAEIGCDQLIAAATLPGESSPAARPLSTPLPPGIPHSVGEEPQRLGLAIA